MKREHEELAQDTADLTQVSREEGSRLKGPDAYRNKTILAPMVRVVRLPCPCGFYSLVLIQSSSSRVPCPCACWPWSTVPTSSTPRRSLPRSSPSACELLTVRI